MDTLMTLLAYAGLLAVILIICIGLGVLIGHLASMITWVVRLVWPGLKPGGS